MKILVLMIMFLAAASAAQAGYGAGDPRLSKLYSSFMAPCCYGGDLSIHNSTTAAELRARIALMVREGQTDEQIRDTLVSEYGERILSVPEGSAHTWLFWMPGFFAVIGLGIVIWFLRRMRHAAPKPVVEGGHSPG